MTSVCVAGAGAIGSLFAGHLARVAEVTVLTRREEQARALEEHFSKKRFSNDAAAFEAVKAFVQDRLAG